MPEYSQPHMSRAVGAPQEVLRRRLRLMGVVLAVATLLMLLKAGAWWLTGSRGLLADAVESLTNVLTASFGLFSVWLAARPPDENHPYGHGRIEFFAEGLQGLLVLVAGLGILRESIPALANPRALANLGAGGGLAVAAAVCNGVVGLVLLRRGRRERSPMMLGEGQHLLSDTFTTVGVLAGLGLVQLTGKTWFDPLAACVVGVVVTAAGLRLLRQSARRLMDSAEPQLLREVVRTLSERRRAEWIEVHLLRARSAGETVHIDFHVSLPRYWTLDEAHDVQEALGQELLEGLDRRGEVLVHADPCHGGLCRSCRVADCPVREAAFGGHAPWTLARLSGPLQPARPPADDESAPAEEPGEDARRPRC